MDLSPKIGVKLTPELLEKFFRPGQKIFCQAGVPPEYKLRTYGYDSDKDEFFFIWESLDCPEGATVTWMDTSYEEA